MECQLILNCTQFRNSIIKLSPAAPSFSVTAIVENITLLEDASYTGEVILDGVTLPIQTVNLYLNGKVIGHGIIDTLEKSLQHTQLQISFDDDKYGYYQPFLLQHDLVILSVKVIMEDCTSEEFYSDYLVCVSKHPDDNENVAEILKELVEFDDDKVNKWIFANNTKRDQRNSLLEGEWKNKAYKSLNSYIQMLEAVLECYRSNLSYFRSMAKHTISKTYSIQSHEKVRIVTNISFSWLMQNTNQLVKVPYKTAITYNGHNYMPFRLQTEEQRKDWNIYENQVTLGFLAMVCQSVEIIEADFVEEIFNEERILQRLQKTINAGYRAPIITIKSMQLSYSQSLLKRLQKVVSMLKNIYLQYSDALPCKFVRLKCFPRKTKIFQEVKPYNQVFEQIAKWYRYGEFDLRKEKFILQVKTLDKLFEYYCLYKLLIMLAQAGFIEQETDKTVFSYEYNTTDGLYENEQDIANTFCLVKDDCFITLYYQPVIHADNFENNITLYRTTSNKLYFAPDFILKIQSKDSLPKYVVFDSKYSTRANIKKHYMDDTILQYSCQIADIHSNSSAIKMVWLLQGRVDGFVPIWRYHDSPMSRRYIPEPSYGIISINTKSNMELRLWREIESII